jgi:two-component system chemotaxis response regulator CheB
VVQHRPERDRDVFVDVLRSRLALPVRLLREGDSLAAGVVHVVPAGMSAELARDGVSLHPVRDYRSADPVFVSAAAAFGPRLLAAVLTGRLDDAALGVRHVKGAGGRVLAQEPATAAAAGMPGAAIATGCVDFVLPLPVLAHALTSLVMAPGAANMMRVALPSWASAIPPVAVGA